MNPTLALVLSIFVLNNQIFLSECGLLGKDDLTPTMKMLDDRFSSFEALGDEHSGLPEGIGAVTRHCVEFVVSGLFILGFTIARWPLKLLMKAVILTGAFSHIKAMAMWCLNPITMGDFAEGSKLVNTHSDKLAEFRHILKKRLMYAVDKVHTEEKQKYSCCAWFEWKRQIFEEVPEATSFLKRYFRGHYGLPAMVYCQQYQGGSAACEAWEPVDEEPDRIIPRNWLTIVFEILSQMM